MGRVLGIHRMVLKPGVDAQAFERFVIEKFAPIYHHYEPRQAAYLLKGDRGEATGQYALLIEIESVEARNDIYPVEGQMSAELLQAMAATAAIWAELDTFTQRFPDPGASDYVVMGGE